MAIDFQEIYDLAYEHRNDVGLRERLLEKVKKCSLEELEDYVAWVPSIKKAVGRPSNAENQMYGHVLLSLFARAAGPEVAELSGIVASATPLVLTLGDPSVVPTALEFCARVPEPVLIEAFEDHDISFFWGSNISFSMLGLVHDRGGLDRIVAGVLEWASDHTAEELATTLAAHGEHVLPSVRAAWSKAVPTTSAKVIVSVLDRAPHPDNAPTLVEALGHRSRVVHERAKAGLRALGEGARAALEEGSSARKRAVKEFCELRLEELGEPGEGVQEAGLFEQLDEATRASMISRVEEIRTNETRSRDRVWKKFITKEVSSAPVAWLAAELHVMKWGVSGYDIQDLIMRTLEVLADHEEAERMWATYLEELCATDASDAHKRGRFMRHAERAPREVFAECMRSALPVHTGPMAADMFELYAERRERLTPELVRFGMTHRLKKVRDAAASLVGYWRASCDPAPLLELASARKKDHRAAAAQALARCHVDNLVPFLDALEEWADGERVEAIASQITGTIERVRAANSE